MRSFDAVGSGERVGPTGRPIMIMAPLSDDGYWSLNTRQSREILYWHSRASGQSLATSALKYLLQRFGAIAPDVDLLYFYFVDGCKHHHHASNRQVLTQERNRQGAECTGARRTIGMQRCEYVMRMCGESRRNGGCQPWLGCGEFRPRNGRAGVRLRITCRHMSGGRGGI